MMFIHYTFIKRNKNNPRAETKLILVTIFRKMSFMNLRFFRSFLTQTVNYYYDHNSQPKSSNH